MHNVTIYTDGACKGNPGPSGWAFYIAMSNSPDKYAIRSGCIAQGTNNIAELTAVIEALSTLKYSCIVDLYSDSMYVINGCTDWLNKWKKNGYVNSKKRTIENVELWKRIDYLMSKHSIKFHYVKGHSGDRLNDLVDMHASNACDQVSLVNIRNV